jgi:hypothetical protein
VPVACVASALFTWLLNGFFIQAFHFDFGFMNIFVNALLTIFFLFIIRKKEKIQKGSQREKNITEV